MFVRCAARHSLHRRGVHIARVSAGDRVAHAVVCPDGTYREIIGDAFGAFQVGAQIPGSVAGSVLAPVVPPAIVCIGLNYRQHAQEAGFELPRFPVFFLKAPSAVTPHGSPVVIPRCAADPPEVDFEAEMALVIGATCVDVQPEDALSVVAGYTAANDVSARRWQGRKGGGQWSRAKSFRSFCPLGPYLSRPGRVNEQGRFVWDEAAARRMDSLPVKMILNGELMQDGSTSDMVFSVSELVAFLSQDTVLEAGTVILTGTPQGVGYARSPPRFLCAGDVMQVHVGDLPPLENVVATH